MSRRGPCRANWHVAMFSSVVAGPVEMSIRDTCKRDHAPVAGSFTVSTPAALYSLPLQLFFVFFHWSGPANDEWTTNNLLTELASSLCLLMSSPHMQHESPPRHTDSLQNRIHDNGAVRNAADEHGDAKRPCGGTAS